MIIRLISAKALLVSTHSTACFCQPLPLGEFILIIITIFSPACLWQPGTLGAGFSLSLSLSLSVTLYLKYLISQLPADGF